MALATTTATLPAPGESPRRTAGAAEGAGAEPRTLRQKDWQAPRGRSAAFLTGERLRPAQPAHRRGKRRAAGRRASSISQVKRTARASPPALQWRWSRCPRKIRHVRRHRPAAATHPAARPAPRTRRPHGALRRLRHAGVSTRPASWPSTCTAAARRRCSTSRTWARCGCSAPTPPRALETLVPVDVVGLRVGQQRYGLLHQRDRRHPRRPDGHARRGPTRRPAADRQRRLQGGRHRAPDRRTSATAARCSRCPSARCWRCRARRPSTRWRGSTPGVARLTFMTGGAFTLAGADCFVTRSGYTGEDGFEISVPGRRRPRRWPARCWRSPRSSRPAWARATRCAWRPACACTATTSTRAPRRSRPA